jgi:GPH family glycoside/pentoside/hexuronide:cation symporter
MQRQQHTKALRNIPLIDKIGYGAGNLTFGVVIQIISTYMVFYSTVIHNLPGSIIGLAIGISVVWDAISDPVMGHISDHTNSKKFGRRHFYILIGTFSIAFFNFFIWILPIEMPAIWKTVIIISLLIIVKTSTTIFSVPHTALGAELTDDYNERSSIQGIRSIFFILGLFSANVMGMFLFFKPTAEYPQGQMNPAAYSNMGITASLIAIIFGFICYITTKKYIPALNQNIISNNKQHGMWHSIKQLFSSISAAFTNDDYRYVVLGYMFTNVASALIGAVGMHVFTYTFSFRNYGIALIFGVLFGVSILSQPIWIKISERLDKKPSIVLGLGSSLVGAIYFLILVFLKDSVAGQAQWFLPFAALSGFGMGGLFTMPLSMVADIIDVEELASGERKEGLYYGCMTLSYKLSQSVAIFILGTFLDLVRFDSNLPVQPQNTVLALGLILAVGCILSIGLAILCYSKYKLNRSKIEEVQQQLELRKQNI